MAISNRGVSKAPGFTGRPINESATPNFKKFLRSRARAIAQIIEESGKLEGLSFFASNSAPLEGYEVHTCLGIPYETLQSVPRFNSPMRHDYHGRHIEESLVQAVIQTCLARADRALYLPYPGEALRELGDPIDIIRNSAELFVDGISLALTSQHTNLFRRANEISSLTYERSGAKGHFVVTNPVNLINKLEVNFENRVGLNETRGLGKILQLTDNATTLLTDGGYTYGLGECNSAPDVAKIAIEAYAKWSLSIDGTTLMGVSYEHPTLPKQIVDKELFKDSDERTVGAINLKQIWNVFQCALDNDHSTTIVVSKNPASESTNYMEKWTQRGLVVSMGRSFLVRTVAVMDLE